MTNNLQFNQSNLNQIKLSRFKVRSVFVSVRIYGPLLELFVKSSIDSDIKSFGISRATNINNYRDVHAVYSTTYFVRTMGITYCLIRIEMLTIFKELIFGRLNAACLIQHVFN